ncbi:MAG: sensor histidine kinase [Marinifilaceae bacterium]
MKLIYKLLIRLFIVFTLLLGVWAIGFYVAIMDEVNDEVDDQLENYAENIIERVKEGRESRIGDNGSNNQYILLPLENFAIMEGVTLKDTTIVLTSMDETEPARMLTTQFIAQNVPYELKVFTPTIEKKDLRESILYWIIVLYISLLVLLMVIVSWVFFRSMQPFYKLLHWLDNYKTGQKNKVLNIKTDITEFKKVNDAVIRYTNRTEKLFEQQREFIGNASHEMQTPIAICRNRLEILMEDESLSVTQLEELAKTYQTLEYLTRMNKSLLLLSKIDNGQFTESQDVNINHIITRYLEDYSEMFEHMDIRVEQRTEETLLVHMNVTLAEILISNLLRNAYVHNRPQGVINIVTTSGGLTVTNTAINGPLDTHRIFERFYQGTKKEGSTGLGLALVASICKLQHLHIGYTYSDGMHKFEVSTRKKR